MNTKFTRIIIIISIMVIMAQTACINRTEVEQKIITHVQQNCGDGAIGNCNTILP